MQQTDYFLNVDDKKVKGESTAKDHEDEIQLYEFSWGENQEGSGGGGGGAGAGKVKMGDLVVRMQMNKASPELMLACAKGAHYDKVVLTCRKAGGKQENYLAWTLTEAIVTKYETTGKEVQVNGETTVIPLDEVRFGFKSIKVEYKPQKNDGSLGPAVTAGWDRKTTGTM